MKQLIGPALLAAAVLAAALAAPFTSPARASAQSPFVSPDAVATLIVGVPVTLTAPGLYRLASDLTGVSGMNGIIVDADHVMLDLGGFTLYGADGTGTGIRLQVDRSNLTVANGRVTNWGTGLSMGNQSNVRSVLAEGNTNGFSLEGSFAEACEARNNANAGFILSTGNLVRGCIATDNGAVGFNAFRTTLEDCVAGGVEQDTAFLLASGSVARNCRTTGAGGATAFSAEASSLIDCLSVNFEDAFRLSAGSEAERCRALNSDVAFFADASRLERCTVLGTTNKGIELTDGSFATACTVSNTTVVGIDVREASVAERCAVRRELLQARGDAIWVGRASTVRECTVDAPAANGIVATGSDATITRNTVSGAGAAGIVAATHGFVTHNAVSGCTGAAIFTEGDANRFEQNTVRASAFGFRVAGKDNLIIRNDGADNGAELSVAPGNTRGPLITDQDWIQNVNPQSNFDLTF